MPRLDSTAGQIVANERSAPTSPAPLSLQLAARIAVSNLHKNTLKSFSETCVLHAAAVGAYPRRPWLTLPAATQLCLSVGVFSCTLPLKCAHAHRACTALAVCCRMKIMRQHINPKNGEKAPLLADDVYEIVMEVGGGGVGVEWAGWVVSDSCYCGIVALTVALKGHSRRLAYRLAYRPLLPAQHSARLDSEIVYDRDFDYDYFGFKVGGGGVEGVAILPALVSCLGCSMSFALEPCAPACLQFEAAVEFVVGPPLCLQTLERSYLLRVNGTVVERPQHMLMRVAVGIHKRVGGGNCVRCTPRLASPRLASNSF